MRLAWKELIRRPARFLSTGGALTLIVVLLLLLGGLLDGLTLSATGAYGAQTADLLVYTDEANGSLFRSRIDPDVRAQLEDVEGVHTVSGIGAVLLPARIAGSPDPTDVAVFGYEAPNAQVPAPPAGGEAYVDRTLADAGLALGEIFAVGPAAVELRAKDWVDDTSFLAQAGVWADGATWREVLAANRPDAVLPDGTWQALLVEAEGDVDAGELASQIEAATPGLDPQTRAQAILGLPGVEAQQGTFTNIIVMTFVIAGLVVALFFALLTLERVGLFGVLKAIGTSSRTLAGGLVVQAVAIAVGAFVVGGLVTIGLTPVVPPDVPIELVPRRAIVTALGLVVTALIGSAVSFRRIVRIDPASAVGGS
jgi:putative ABC transport system permease protein